MKGSMDGGMIAFGGIEILLFILIPIILMIWGLVSISKKSESDTSLKFLWALAVIFIPVIGPILYLSIGKKKLISSAELR